MTTKNGLTLEQFIEFDRSGMIWDESYKAGYEAGASRAPEDAANEELPEFVGLMSPAVIQSLGKAFDASGLTDESCPGCKARYARAFQAGFIEGWTSMSDTIRFYGRP